MTVISRRRMKDLSLLLVIAMAFTFFMPAISSAAVALGSVTGYVYDNVNNAVYGATVTHDTYSVTTDVYGQFFYNNLPAGGYTFTASKTGYTTSASVYGIVYDGQTTTLDNLILVPVAPVAAPTFVSAKTNVTGSKVSLEFSKAMADPTGKHAQFTVTAGGIQDNVTAAALNSTTTVIDLTVANAVYNGQTVTVSYTAGDVAAADGGLLATFAAQTVTNNVPLAITTPTVTVGAGNTNLAITASTPATTITIPRNVTNATINVGQLLNAPVGLTVTSAPLPQINLVATTSLSTNPVLIAIPAGTTVTAPAGWDGTINVPTPQANNSVTVTADAGMSASVQAVIEVGFGDVPLTFSKAVRLLVPGQAGKYAGYYRGITFTKITTPISVDSQVNGDALVAGGDGKIDVNFDLVIWTKHFTKFATYTQSASGGGGGGGGGGTTVTVSNTTSVTAKTGGTVTADGLVIVIPADAVAADIKVSVQKVTDTSGLPTDAYTKLLSDVFDITKDTAGNFNKNITITLNYDKSKVDTDKYDIAICWLDTTTNKWVKLDNVNVDLAAGKVSGDVNHFTRFAVVATQKENAGGLKDITGHWAQANINKLVNLGAITGYPDGTFKPDNNITRAEFATVLVKAFKLAPNTSKVFKDTANHWAKDSIATAASNGIVNGYDAATFGPDDLITREQMAVMIVRAAKISMVNEGTSFADKASISEWAKSAIATATKNGIMKGYPDNTVQPSGNATRAEAVTVIVNALK